MSPFSKTDSGRTTLLFGKRGVLRRTQRGSRARGRLTHAFKRRQGGFGMADLLLALVLLGGAMGVIGSLVSATRETERENAAAAQMSELHAAAVAWARTEWSAGTTLIPAVGGHLVYPVASIRAGLETAGLDSTFVNATPFNETLEIVLERPLANSLRVMTYTVDGPEDRVRDDGVSNRIAAKITSGRGGFISSTLAVALGDPATMAYGAGGTWELDMAPFGLGDGNIVAVTTLGETEMVDDRLYRFAIPGREWANRMETDLDMNNHEIDRISNAHADEVYLRQVCTPGTVGCAADADDKTNHERVARGVYNIYLVQNGDTVPRPDCNTATTGLTPSLFLTPVSFADQNGSPVGAVYPTANAAWTVSMYVWRYGAWQQSQGYMQAITKCQ